MIYFDIDFAIKLQSDIIDKIGGLKGFNKNQLGYLQSALQHIQNDDLYPNLSDKTAHLIFACVKFHPFLDGNKRSAIYLSQAFLALNDVVTSEEYFIKMEEIVLKIAENALDKKELKNFLEEDILEFQNAQKIKKIHKGFER